MEDKIAFWGDQMRRVLAPPRGSLGMRVSENVDGGKRFHRISRDQFGAAAFMGPPEKLFHGAKLLVPADRTVRDTDGA